MNKRNKRKSWKNLIYRYAGEEGNVGGIGEDINLEPPAQESDPAIEGEGAETNSEQTEINKRLEELEKKLKAAEDARRKSEKELAIQKSNLVKKSRESMSEAEKLAEREKEIAEKEKELALRLSRGIAIEGLTKAGFSETDYADVLDYLIDADETTTRTRIDGITALLIADRDKTIKETKKAIFKSNPNLQGVAKSKDADPIKDGFLRGARSVMESSKIFK